MSAHTVAVTGASGFVGGLTSLALSEAGHRVIALGRRPATAYEHRDYALTTPIADSLLADLDTVIHCAYDLRLTDKRAIEAVNVGGTRALVDAARRADTRVILVSSMSAYPETKQVYGQAKLRSERDVLDSGGEAVRLGLVWGGTEGGMIGTLKRLAALPVVPTFGRDLYQFTVHADDVGAGFVKLVDRPRFGEPLGLAHPVAVPFERILTDMGAGKPPRFVRVPWPPTYAALRAAEQLRLRLPVRADSLLGLVRPAPSVANAQFWPDVGLQLRAFAEPPRQGVA
jgi:nucleoside-diphosphate-sugar epimerase